MPYQVINITMIFHLLRIEYHKYHDIVRFGLLVKANVKKILIVTLKCSSGKATNDMLRKPRKSNFASSRYQHLYVFTESAGGSADVETIEGNKTHRG